MDETNEFQYFHEYRRLALDGLVNPLTCECGIQYVTVSRDGALALWCPVDDTDMTPGFALRFRVEEAVNRYRDI